MKKPFPISISAISIVAVFVVVAILRLFLEEPTSGGYSKVSPDGKYVASASNIFTKDSPTQYRFSLETSDSEELTVEWIEAKEPMADFRSDHDRKFTQWAPDSSHVSYVYEGQVLHTLHVAKIVSAEQGAAPNLRHR